MGNINCHCTCNGMKEGDFNISQFKCGYQEYTKKVTLIQTFFRRYMVQKSYQDILPCKKNSGSPKFSIVNQIKDPNEILYATKTSKYFTSSTIINFSDPMLLKELENYVLNQYRDFFSLDISMNYFLSDKNPEKTILLKESDYVYKKSTFSTTIKLFILTTMSNFFIIGPKTDSLKKITYNYDITNVNLENSISMYTQIPASKIHPFSFSKIPRP